MKVIQHSLVATVENCPRCGKNHEDMLFMVIPPNEGLDQPGQPAPKPQWWSQCPTTAIPIITSPGEHFDSATRTPPTTDELLTPTPQDLAREQPQDGEGVSFGGGER